LLHSFAHNSREHLHSVLSNKTILDGRTKEVIWEAVKYAAPNWVILKSDDQIDDLGGCRWAGQGHVVTLAGAVEAGRLRRGAPPVPSCHGHFTPVGRVPAE
jgi:hypothetical protein